jgi:hypothetical protein
MTTVEETFDEAHVPGSHASLDDAIGKKKDDLPGAIPRCLMCICL